MVRAEHTLELCACARAGLACPQRFELPTRAILVAGGVRDDARGEADP
jgi:hypothetical protein